MARKKTAAGKESSAQKAASLPRLKKAVPAPDNPMLRHLAEEVVLEGGDTTQAEMARLRAKAWEQIQTADPDSNDKKKKT
jgi:hypothetical protein